MNIIKSKEHLTMGISLQGIVSEIPGKWLKQI